MSVVLTPVKSGRGEDEGGRRGHNRHGLVVSGLEVIAVATDEGRRSEKKLELETECPLHESFRDIAQVRHENSGWSLPRCAAVLLRWLGNTSQG